MAKLISINVVEATLELVTGLCIGAGDSEMHIGGVDNTVIKHPYTHLPYIPGSSLKGKIRSLLEWRSGVVQEAALGWRDYQNASGTQKAEVKRILQLFGISAGDTTGLEEMLELGPTRAAFWDCNLQAQWEQRMRQDNLPLEVKSENRINRISSVAEHPRHTERVPAGVCFDFRLSLKELTGDEQALLTTLLQGLKLLELDSLGGSGSRGYGKIRFKALRINRQDSQSLFDGIEPFAYQTQPSL